MSVKAPSWEVIGQDGSKNLNQTEKKEERKMTAMDPKTFDDEINKIKNKSLYFMAYGKKDGELIDIIPAPGCEVVEEGVEPMSLLDMKKLIEKLIDQEKKTSWKTKRISIQHASGSPGCQIVSASGRYKCICPR
jgi:hypothetical protein